MANGSISFPPRLAVDTFRDRVLQEQSSGLASTANYHQSRGLIKVWLSSECSRGNAEEGGRPGGGVPPKITLCLSEAGAVKLDCWPLSTFDPKNQGAWRFQQLGERKLTRGRGKKLLVVRCGQEKWDAMSPERRSLMRSRRNWMYRRRPFCTEQYERGNKKNPHNLRSPHLSRRQ